MWLKKGYNKIGDLGCKHLSQASFPRLMLITCVNKASLIIEHDLFYGYHTFGQNLLANPQGNSLRYITYYR